MTDLSALAVGAVVFWQLFGLVGDWESRRSEMRAAFRVTDKQ